MQPINTKKENIKITIYVVVSLILVILFLRGCNAEKTQPAIVTIPEQKGSFKSVKPEQVVIHDTIKVTKYIAIEDKQRIIDLSNENKYLQQMYNEASDSLKKAMYVKAIEIKSFTNTFEDEKITANVSGLVRGEVQSVKLDYTIKEQKIEVPKQKETFLRLLAGGGIEVNKGLNQFGYKLNAGLQNRKGNILSIGYDKINNQEYFSLNYSISIFNLKR